MPDILLIDPLGRQVTLHVGTWFGHVLRRHPSMRQHQALAEQAVRQPLAVHRSKSDADCRTYYAAGPRPGIFVAVVANIAGGFVKTAYLTDRTKGVPE